MSAKKLKDPAGGDYFWALDDIKTARRHVTEMIFAGEINGKTLKPMDESKSVSDVHFAMKFSDGVERNVLPVYVGSVWNQWCLLYGVPKE